MLRQTLGDLSSIICFKAAILGMEDVLGEKTSAIVLTAAGRTRGKNLAKELGLTTSLSLDDLTYKLNSAIGKEGTRLCIVHKVFQDNDTIKVYTSETLCSSGEPEGSKRKCTYTLGAVWGAIEQSFGKRFQGKHTISVLDGGDYDVFEFTELG